MIGALVLAGLGVWTVATSVRVWAAHRFFAADERAPAPETQLAELTILQPILGGDPALRACLESNLANTPGARFLWLVDEDDPLGRAAIEGLTDGGRVQARFGPPPRDGENPKVAKLARALPEVATACVAVLDDDTVLPRDGARRALAALEGADLVTGLPIYADRSTVWSRLVSGFVNGSALLTYPVAAQLGAGRTINGMFWLTRTETLRELGGFNAIGGALTDDYATARLYLDAGMTLRQSAVLHPITTTVEDAAHYARLMRRWMIFSLRYARENATGFTVGLVAVPTLLPLPLVIGGLAAGAPVLGLVLLALGLKAAANAWLRERAGGGSSRWTELLAEIVADLLTPFHLLAALVAGDRFTWRTRDIRMAGERITFG